jgi:hypothetical protein
MLIIMRYTKMPKESTMKKVLSIFQMVMQDHNCTRYQGFPCAILLTDSQGWVVTFPWELLRFSKSLTWRPTNKVGTLNLTLTNMVQMSKKTPNVNLVCLLHIKFCILWSRGCIFQLYHVGVYQSPCPLWLLYLGCIWPHEGHFHLIFFLSTLSTWGSKVLHESLQIHFKNEVHIDYQNQSYKALTFYEGNFFEITILTQ